MAKTSGDGLVEMIMDWGVEQALHFAESLAGGPPHRGRIAATVLSDTLPELV